MTQRQQTIHTAELAGGVHMTRDAVKNRVTLEGPPLAMELYRAVLLRVEVKVDYTNYKGERRVRTIRPSYVVRGSTPEHPEEQWLLQCWDVEKMAERTYAVAGIHGIVA